MRALRMGGAADLYDLYGPAGERYIRERGRWSSDVAHIYARVSASAHGELSRLIGDSAGADLQSMLSGWCQLAMEFHPHKVQTLCRVTVALSGERSEGVT